MTQQAPDQPRSVQIITRYSALIGLMAILGLLGGAVFAALNPPASSGQALVMFTAPSCPQGAICGGAMFSPGYVAAEMASGLPAGVRIEPVTGNVLSITATGATAAQAASTADATARAYIVEAGSLSYLGEHPSASLLEPATASAPVSPKRLLDDALLGAVFGLLVGVIAALAAGQTIIDPVTLPRGVGVGVGVGGESRRAGRASGYGSTRLSLQQMALDYANRKPDPDRPEAFSPFPGETEGPRLS
jgi:hypothetical protein